METCANYIVGDRMFFSSDERKWATRIHKLKETYPDDVKIIREPEDNFGCIYASVPSAWLKISPKRTLDLSDEERAAIADRFRAARERNANEANDAL